MVNEFLYEVKGVTQEQRMHQDEYDCAKRKYENAYISKRNAENELISIQNRRRQILDEINQNKTDRNRFFESSQEIAKTSQNDSDISIGITDSETKLEAATVGFSAIGSASYCKPQNLVAVFEERDRNTKNVINGIFDNLKNTQNTMNQKIEEFDREIQRLQDELENGERRERILSNTISECSRTMTNATYTMAYHKKYIQQ